LKFSLKDKVVVLVSEAEKACSENFWNSAGNYRSKQCESHVLYIVQGMENSEKKNAKGFLRVVFSKKMQRRLFSSEHVVR
jgi:hypothetical protein